MEACPRRYGLGRGRVYQLKEVVGVIYNRRYHRTVTEGFLIAGGGSFFPEVYSVKQKFETMKIYPLYF